MFIREGSAVVAMTVSGFHMRRPVGGMMMVRRHHHAAGQQQGANDRGKAKGSVKALKRSHHGFPARFAAAVARR